MKRVILLTVIMMVVAANSFATDISYTFADTFSGFSKSKNVIVGYASGISTGGSCTSAPATCVHFVALAKNTAGDKTYGAVDTQGFVYMISATAGTALSAIPSGIAVPTSGIYAPTGSWTAM